MGVGAAWAQKAALSMLGAGKSALFPDVLWLGFTDATDTEPAGLVRVAVPNDGLTWAGSGAGAATIVAIDAGVAGAAWPELVTWVLSDAATGGNPILSGVLDDPITPVEGDPLTVPVGGLRVEVA